MSPLSLSQVADPVLGAPDASRGSGENAAPAADFSSILADAAGGPLNPTDASAAEPRALSPAALQMVSEAAAHASAPSVVRANLLQAGPSYHARTMGAPANSDEARVQEVPSSTCFPAEVPAITDAADAAPQQSRQLPLQFLSKHTGAGALAAISAPSIIAATTAAVLPNLRMPKPAALAALGSGETNKEDNEDSDAPALAVQQVLAAAASLTAPSSPSPLQPGSQQSSQAALMLDTRMAFTASRKPKPEAGAVELQEHKASAAAADALPTVLSTEPGLVVGTHGPTMPHTDRAPAISGALASPAQALDGAVRSHATDLHQLDALVRDIAEVSGNTGRAALRLTADQLGSLEIKLHRSDSGMNVTIRTETERSHAAVSQAQQQLSEDLRANGLKVAATSVMLGHGGADGDRRERQPFTFSPPIEAAPATNQQSNSEDDERPAGRFA